MRTARDSLGQAGAPQNGVLETAFSQTCARFKPVMHLAFLEYFPSPRDWHRARQLYARSASVSSMVGYIVGLGDRHPNNILWDQTTGEVVHIDFGYTFDQAKGLRVPELVPFRLTRDMADGLGCLGTCGLFRRCCETTMEVLRNSAPLVEAITEVFVHDPIYMWSFQTKSNKAQQDNAAEQGGEGLDAAWLAKYIASNQDGNDMAQRALLAVRAKLHGEHGAAASLGVSAHVGWLIREAVDPTNLAKMFSGWSAWL